MQTEPRFWIAFNSGIIALLAVDLYIFHRKTRTVGWRESVAWTAVWIGLSLSFNAWIWHWKGEGKAVEFLAGYLIEYSLSIDNMFVFVLIFSFLKIKPEHQYRVLFWGILGALAMRGGMIVLGVRLVARFNWILYLFGLFLLVTGIRMFFKKNRDSMATNRIVCFCAKWMRVTPETHGSKFFLRENGRWVMTQLVLALLVVDVMDLVFAVDSIPAVFAVTTDSFIIYTSNICAILGLRSLYFLLAHLANRFVYLHYGLASVLCFIGVKMLVADWVTVPATVSLVVVAFMLGASIAASLETGPD